MGYPESEWERGMRVQEVMMRALSGAIHWFQAAEILGVDVRTMRRWRERFEHNGCHAVFDRRRQMPSPRSTARTRCGAEPSASDSLMRRVGPWTLPPLWMSERPGRPRGAWTAGRRRPPAHSVHRHHFSESGQFTC
jgi:hypothetical protein